MPSGPMPRLTLRTLILSFALLAALVTVLNSFYVSYQVQRSKLILNALEANQAYAAKLAEGIEETLVENLSRQRYSASVLAHRFADPQSRLDEVRRLFEQDSSFNSVLVADDKGLILASWPAGLNINGQTMRFKAPLEEQRPMISPPFESLAGNLVVFLSHPVFDAEGRYLGLVGGTIYLDQTNALSKLISDHYYQDRAQVYVVDQTRLRLYHPVRELIGQRVDQNRIVDAVLSGKSGSMQAPNSMGVEMLAGYASVPTSRWGVVSQQPLEYTLANLKELMLETAAWLGPTSLGGLLVLLWVSLRITLPLRQLAETARHLDSPDSANRLRGVHSWYAEAWQIRRALYIGVQLMSEKIGRLNAQAQSDALTGLANRRMLDETLQEWARAGRGFSVIAMDIDHFKQVNDRFGHDSGDAALKAIAETLRQNCRAGDLACRAGGEEFTLLLPDTPLEIARDIAERIRRAVEVMPIEPVGLLTLSFGVATWQPEQGEVGAALKQADALLYRAKQAGRNRVEAELPQNG